ncbi:MULTISPECIES: hypothetical protein [unclassified Chryseobacterium]|uniref:hypothetical protein n=1 Tax=unclassified Chryseobacterium TaxID=2593645 RepID=UPI001AE24A4F|nr:MULTISPECIES: hypothetical protein [unclassified Chryseobacterium]MBP1165003.1 hypothetical protein [Chryseobacterium sp. PvR013]MDR4891005.1 hypothetical protein [Chryseobacterium sp. CFS7]
MKLRYVLLLLENEVAGKIYSSHFLYHTRFISNYFSKAIRKYKFDTDGTFNMVSIALLPENKLEPTKITAIDVLETYLPFDQNRYEKTKGTEDCNYYLEVLEEGFKKAAVFKPIPLEDLLSLITEFKKGGCKNEWVHKKKRFKEIDIEVVLKCEFTTNYFQLIATINQISTKKELTKGIVIKTKPDEIHFDKMFKDIVVYKNFIVITDASDSAMALINIKEAQKCKFEKTFAPYIYSDDYTQEENEEFEKTHNRVIEILSYDDSGFSI